uniref:secretory carrier-associated membrane protein 5 isoform X2 n=1 Tax=Ictidomys tridecemlineatus TaxID=43179 RepID=UPI001A9D1E21|nr:secretory carrier-associated membrane protein 5 isoform X2 [Ictidomys tridecemlineatus]
MARVAGCAMLAVAKAIRLRILLPSLTRICTAPGARSANGPEPRPPSSVPPPAGASSERTLRKFSMHCRRQDRQLCHRTASTPRLHGRGSRGPAGLEVTVVTTERAKHFYNPQDIPVTLYSDSDEWEMWKHRSDPVLHIDLRRWADLMLVAPLDANTLGKVASGICDNLLTCVIRAWDRSKPLLFCPAMNTVMWEHPLTAQQVDQLKAFGYVEIPCVDKKLVCGDQGLGAMAEVETIVDKVKEVLSQHSGVQQS